MDNENNIRCRATHLEILCPEKWFKALQHANETEDESLKNCVWNLMNWCQGDPNATIHISSDFGEHCFFFQDIDGNGNVGICGGIVYHGNPKSGYKQNGSVQLTPSYGWQIHT